MHKLLHPSALALAIAAALGLAACSGEPAPQRKMQTVKLLPDTPPPPPPPPKPEDKRPEPKQQDKPLAVPKPEAQPEQQALRSDEAAGDGPGNGLVAGVVTQDYTDQKIGQATVGASAADSGASRVVATHFARQTTRSLNEFLAREREVKRSDYQVRVDLWLTPSGGLQRAELVGSTGDTSLDQALRGALERFPGTGTPPQRLPQPLRVLVSNRLMG